MIYILIINVLLRYWIYISWFSIRYDYWYLHIHIPMSIFLIHF